MASIDEMIRSYVASWNESDPTKRDQTIEKTWSPDGIYRNATAEFEGYGGIARAVTAAHDAFVANGFVFTLANVDTNHDAVRYRWEMLPASGGAPDSIGTHVAVVGPDGRLVSDHQFIDQAPSTS
jgi:SnoaL-like domain